MYVSVAIPAGNMLEMEQTVRAVPPILTTPARLHIGSFVALKPLILEEEKEMLQKTILGSTRVCPGVTPL